MNVHSMSMRWLKQLSTASLVSLAIAGFYSIALVVLRAPILSQLIDKSIFNIALVVHVDLSVLFWLVTMSMIITIMHHRAMTFANMMLVRAGIPLLYLSIFLVCISPIVDPGNINGEAYLNNYVPMYNNLLFVLGIAIFICVMALFAIFGLTDRENVFGISTGGITLAALLSLAISGIEVDRSAYVDLNNPFGYDLSSYYEVLFWPFGHILQFIYTNVLLYIWLEDKSKFMRYALLANAILVLPMPFLQVIYGDQGAVAQLFTNHMKYFGGIVPTIVMLYTIFMYLQYNVKPKRHVILSMTLFFVGGLIGEMIQTIDVTVPAHYHGCIIGISIACMGYFYEFLPKIYHNGGALLHGITMPKKAMRYQMYVYFYGQMIHILALAWSGGYGALRKAPGMELSTKAKVAMSVMGIGGLMAIIGGLMFVLIISKIMFRIKMRMDSNVEYAN